VNYTDHEKTAMQWVCASLEGGADQNRNMLRKSPRRIPNAQASGPCNLLSGSACTSSLFNRGLLFPSPVASGPRRRADCRGDIAQVVHRNLIAFGDPLSPPTPPPAPKCGAGAPELAGDSGRAGVSPTPEVTHCRVVCETSTCTSNSSNTT